MFIWADPGLQPYPTVWHCYRSGQLCPRVSEQQNKSKEAAEHSCLIISSISMTSISNIIHGCSFSLFSLLLFGHFGHSSRLSKWVHVFKWPKFHVELTGERHLVIMETCVCVFGRVVTHPVFPLCKTSFSGSFMAPLMDTGLVKPCGVCMCMCLCVVCSHTFVV